MIKRLTDKYFPRRYAKLYLSVDQSSRRYVGVRTLSYRLRGLVLVLGGLCCRVTGAFVEALKDGRGEIRIME